MNHLVSNVAKWASNTTNYAVSNAGGRRKSRKENHETSQTLRNLTNITKPHDFTCINIEHTKRTCHFIFVDHSGWYISLIRILHPLYQLGRAIKVPF
jgi:hypothetical protein